jgi:hypothetical protein
MLNRHISHPAGSGPLYGPGHRQDFKNSAGKYAQRARRGARLFKKVNTTSPANPGTSCYEGPEYPAKDEFSFKLAS